MVSVNQEIQEVKEEAGKEDIEDLDLVNHKPNHLVDLIAMTIQKSHMDYRRKNQLFH